MVVYPDEPLSFVHMSKPKICRVKSQSLDYLANKVPMNLRGWVAVAESPHWFAWPKGKKLSSAAQQQEHNFLEASLKNY